MKRITVLTACLLALALAPALQAQMRGYPPPDTYRNPYPDSGRWNRIAALANELEDTATYIHREFERNNRRPNRAEARVAADLHELNAQAARLRAQIEGYGYQDGYGYRDRYGNRDGYGYRQDRRYGRDDFARLEEAFFDLSDSLRYIRPRPYVDRGMDRIYELMNALGRYYGRSGYGQGYSGRDRYGHDRYDGYDQDRNDGYYRPPQ
jgi:hypothetical protein